MNPTEKSATERSAPAYSRVPRNSTAPSTAWCTAAMTLTTKPYRAPIPRAYRMATMPSPPSSPATNTSLHATPSGYGRASSTMNNRRKAMVNMVPSHPPNKAMARVMPQLMSVQSPTTRKAGTVKITPAARLSPALAMVCTLLFSRMLTSLNISRRMIIDMTAAGMLAETVIPAYKPRYAFAAVIRTPSTIPTPSTRTVSSGTVTSGEMKGSSVALTPLRTHLSSSKHRRGIEPPSSLDGRFVAC